MYRHLVILLQAIDGPLILVLSLSRAERGLSMKLNVLIV